MSRTGRREAWRSQVARVCAGTCLALLLVAAQAAGQDLPTAEPPPPPPASEAVRRALQEPLNVSPGGAFLRAVLVPGWGHVAIGSHTRGGFYFALETLTAYTFLRTRARLSEARERADLRESVVRSRLAAQGLTEPAEIEAALDDDEMLSDFRDLVDAREGQQEDLVAWSIFLLFLSGADAYVSAHLGRFPEPLEVEVTPVGSGRADVGLRIRVPNLF